MAQSLYLYDGCQTKFFLNKLVITKFNSKSKNIIWINLIARRLNKKGTCKTDFTFSPPNINYKRFKFNLIFNKSVRPQFHEEVKDNNLESFVFNRSIEGTLIYHIDSSTTVFFKF